MGRIATFLAGVLVGGACVWGALKYHIVRAEDGFHFVPKLSANFNETYVDIRQFGMTDWEQHRSLAVAIVQAGQGDLLQQSATSSLRRSVDSVLEGLRGGPAT